MRHIITLGAILCLSIASSAKNYAILPCEDETVDDVLRECFTNNIRVLTHSDQGANFVLVDVASTNQLENFCYYTELRQKEEHLCFNTNSLLIRVNEKATPSFIELHGFVKHELVPNLYYSSKANNEQELLRDKEEFASLPEVEYVSFNQVFTLDVSVNDPLYNRQWALENNGTPIQYSGTPGADMSIDSAWLISTGNNSISVAVLDSGVDTLHEDLSNNLLPGFDGFAVGGPGTQGYPTPTYSGDGHGTACAGIIAAEANNNVGLAGVAYDCKIIPVRIFYYVDYGAGIGVQGTTTTDALLSGFAYAWRNADADVMSASAGLNDLFVAVLGIDTVLINAELTAAYWEARNWKGLPMFFSSGNDDIAGVLWPANLTKTIGVGASSMCDERKNPSDCSGEAWGGNYDEGLDIVAPGVKITTCDMTGSNGYSGGSYYYEFNGTSASCPNAAGVAALILSVNPGLYAADVRAILNITADRVPGYIYDSTSVYGTWNTEMGHGRVNANSAVLLAQTYQATTSLEHKTETTFSIYPNPSNGEFMIEYDGSSSDNVQLEVTDQQGRLVLSEEINNTGQWSKRIDLSSSEDGIYYLRLIFDHETIERKLVKTK